MALPSTLPSTLANPTHKRAGDVASFAGAGPEEKKKLKKAEISLNDCLACSSVFSLSLSSTLSLFFVFTFLYKNYNSPSDRSLFDRSKTTAAASRPLKSSSFKPTPSLPSSTSFGHQMPPLPPRRPNFPSSPSPLSPSPRYQPRSRNRSLFPSSFIESDPSSRPSESLTSPI